MPFQLEWFANWARTLGEDPTRKGLQGTPARMSAALEEMLNGYKEDPASHLLTTFEEPLAIDPVVVEVDFVSVCEHHVLPFFGRARLAYLPDDGRIVGLSKIPRAVRCLSARLQTQERLTAMIADAFYESVAPVWVEVEIEATHLCVVARGVKTDSVMKTKARRDWKTARNAEDSVGI